MSSLLMKEHTVTTTEDFLYITEFFLTPNKSGVEVLATEMNRDKVAGTVNRSTGKSLLAKGMLSINKDIFIKRSKSDICAKTHLSLFIS